MGYSLLINIHKNTTFLFSVWEPVTVRNRSDIQQNYEYLLNNIVLIIMYNILRRAAMTKFVTFGIRFCLQRGLQVQLFNTYG